MCLRAEYSPLAVNFNIILFCPKKKNSRNNSYQNLKLSTFEIKFSPMSFITCKNTVRWCYYAVYYQTRVMSLVP